MMNVLSTRLLLLLIVAILQQISICQACICNSHPQQTFCSSDFVIKVGITNIQEIQIGDNLLDKYDVEIYKVYRSTMIAKYMHENSIVSIFSSKDTGCGVGGLKVDDVVTLAGLITNSTAIVNTCSTFHSFAGKSLVQREDLLKYYGQNCNKCIIERCYKNCQKKKQCNKCIWEDECHYKWGVCVCKERICQWKETGELRNCQF